MFYYVKNSRSKVIHMRGCHYIRNSDPTQLGNFNSFATAYREGYNPCHHCSEILKLYRREKRKISKYSKENSISIRLFKRYIEFKTDCGEWRVVPSPTEGRTILFHKNYRQKDSDFSSEIPGFHREKFWRDSIRSYVDYIVPHDKQRASDMEQEKPSPKNKPPKKTKGKNHKHYCNQMKAYKRKQRKKRIRELWLALECLAVS